MALLRHFWCPLIDMYSLSDISASQWSSQPSFPASSLSASSQAPVYWFSIKACNNCPGEYISSLGRHPRIGREWAKEGKDCKKFPRAIQICFHVSTENHCFVKENYLPLPVSPISTHLVHIIPLMKCAAVKIQPPKCTSVLLQSNLTKSGRDEDDTTFDLVILFSGKYPRNTLAHKRKETGAKKCSLPHCLKDQEIRNNLNVHQQNRF